MAAKKKIKPKKPTLTREAAIASTIPLCKELVTMAAFQLHDNPKATEQIYRAVRTLQTLANAASRQPVK